MIISLTGFMGCGKSSVGRRLSELLGWRFVDLDAVIEEREGRRIPEIFETEGEAGFRRIEKDVLEELLRGCEDGDGIVLALGGGAVMTEGSGEMVHEGTFCVYLRASVDTLMQNLQGKEAEGRPMLKGSGAVMSSEAETSALRSRISELMKLRSATYERVAHLIVDTDGKSIGEIAEIIIESM